VAKSVTAALDFAASLAQASRIYAGYEADYPGVSATLLQAAVRAFEWAQKNPDAFYRQSEMNKQFDPDVTTGEYGDRDARDEFFWAASELFIATGESKYRKAMDEYKVNQYVIPVWGRVSGLGVLALLRHAGRLEDKGLADEMRKLLISYADSALANYAGAPYAAPYGRAKRDFFWGCNSDGASNQGMTFLHAWKQTEDRKYLTAALHDMDYILGRNATGYCYITGFGTKSPVAPHHRLSASDGIEEPVPGLLAGGPNPGKQDRCEYPSDIADECYTDVQASYASNEIAINWQGLFTYFAAALDANL
jgi:endoglucanase